MIALDHSTPQALHAIGPAVVSIRQHIAVTSGITFSIPKPGKGCTVTYTRPTLAGRLMGVESITTIWCSK